MCDKRCFEHINILSLYEINLLKRKQKKTKNQKRMRHENHTALIRIRVYWSSSCFIIISDSFELRYKQIIIIINVQTRVSTKFNLQYSVENTLLYILIQKRMFTKKRVEIPFSHFFLTIYPNILNVPRYTRILFRTTQYLFPYL